MIQLKGTPGGDVWSQLGGYFAQEAQNNLKQYRTKKGLQSMGVDPIKAEGLSKLPESILRQYITSAGRQTQTKNLQTNNLVDKMFSRRVKDIRGLKDPDESTLMATEQSKSNTISKIESGADPEKAISGGIKNINKIKVGNQILEGKKFNPKSAWSDKGKQEAITKASKTIKPLIKDGSYKQEDAVKSLVSSGWPEEEAVLATSPELTDNIAKLIFKKAGNDPKKAKGLALLYGFKV